MKLVFDDTQFSFELLRTVGHGIYGGADIRECLTTAYRIREGDFDSWYREWLNTADRVLAIADSCAAGGHQVSAREAYLRASNYYRTAEFFVHGDPADPRILKAWRASRDSFLKAATLFSPPIEAVEVPYEGTTLPSYFMKPDSAGGRRPTVIVQTGYDGTGEELYFDAGAAALRRGYNCLVFEGPGQGRVIREQKLYFRPDWEKVVTPMVDYVMTRPEVDPRRIALWGISFGGYLAPRAVCFEHRIAACVANGGIYDVFAGTTAKQPFSPEEMKQFIRQDPSGFDEGCREQARSNSEMRWAMQDGIWKFGVQTPSEWMLKMAECTLEGIAGNITCHMLVCDSETEQFFPGEPRKLYDALACPRDFILFTIEESAEEHCQVGAHALQHQRIYDWLDETMAGIS